jgi:DNA-binding NarL/FixJ family response regulator
MASKLAVSEATIRWHSAQLFKKLNVCSREELAAVLAGSDLPTIPRAPAPPPVTSTPVVLRPQHNISIDWRRLGPGKLRIVRLVTTGMTNWEIAAKLFLFKHTVDSHLKSAFGI